MQAAYLNQAISLLTFQLGLLYSIICALRIHLHVITLNAMGRHSVPKRDSGHTKNYTNSAKWTIGYNLKKKKVHLGKGGEVGSSGETGDVKCSTAARISKQYVNLLDFHLYC